MLAQRNLYIMNTGVDY